MFVDQPISRIRGIGTSIMQSRFDAPAASEIQKAALHLEPRVSPHLLCGQVAFCLLVQRVSSDRITHLAAEICQTSRSAPRPLALQGVEIAVLRSPIMPVLEIEIRPDQTPLVAVINRWDGAQCGSDVCQLVK